MLNYMPPGKPPPMPPPLVMSSIDIPMSCYLRFYGSLSTAHASQQLAPDYSAGASGYAASLRHWLLRTPRLNASLSSVVDDVSLDEIERIRL